MSFCKSIYLAALAICWAVPFANLAYGQQSGSQDPNTASSPSSEATAEIILLPDRLAAQMTLTFKQTGSERTPVLSLIAFDIPADHESIAEFKTELRQDDMSSLAAVVSTADKPREVWFGKIIDLGQHFARLTVDLPSVIKPIEATKEYRLQFQLVDGTLKRLAAASHVLSQATLSNVRAELPEGWEVIDNNWKRDRLSDRKLEYKGTLLPGSIIEIRFKRTISAVKEWMQENMPKFFLSILFITGITIAIIKHLISQKWAMYRIRMIIFICMSALSLYMWYDYNEFGSQGWFERNWWAVCVMAAFFIAIALPISWVDIVLAAAKRSEVEA